MMTLRNWLYALGALGLLVGLWGLYERLIAGREVTATGSYVVWGLWVAMYLFFVGTAGGLFIVATLDLLFHLPAFRNTGRLSLYLTLVTLGAGLFHIWLDLGHPERIWEVYVRPSWVSVMAQLVWGYTLFGLITLVVLMLTYRPTAQQVQRALLWVGVLLAFFLSGAVGALLGVEISRLFWHIGLFPVQFPVFSLASGIAVLMAVVGLFDGVPAEQRRHLLEILGVSTVVLQVVKLYFLWSDFSQSVYGGIPQNVAAVDTLLFGPYWWSFWILQIGLGALVPIIILLIPTLARQPRLVGWAGVFTLIGFAVARANIVFPALSVAELQGLQQAFHDPRLVFDYWPTLAEWSITAGILGAALLASLIGLDRLSLAKVLAAKEA